MNVSRILIAVAGSLTLVSCGAAPAASPPASAVVIDTAGAAEAAQLTDVDPAVRLGNAGLGAAGDLYALDVVCPDRDARPACAARAAVRVAAWLNARPTPPKTLLVNVDGPEGGIGFQLQGPMASTASLTGLTTEAALERFSWDGGSSAGKDAAARYCSATDGQSGFCQALAAKACDPLATSDLKAFCEAKA
jgi:hypothetical protein